MIDKSELVLVTGAAGYIGTRVVKRLLDGGFRNIRCLVRPSTSASRIDTLRKLSEAGCLQIFSGDLFSPADCDVAVKDVSVVLHLAAGRGVKSYPDAFLNTVVVTRNILDACVKYGRIKRFVSVGSFVVYSNRGKQRRRLLDETCPVEERPELRGEAYCYAKARQDDLVIEYGRKFHLPYVIVRPGVVYGPGNTALSGRVGIDTFGIFLHLGGSTQIPLTYVDNCADAIVQVGWALGIDGEIFNIVDDNLPSSRQLLRLYKRNVKRFPSIYVPKPVSYALCSLWARYSVWSQGQLPPAFNTYRWNALWKTTRFTNQKLKLRVGWTQPIPTSEGLEHYFEACRGGGTCA